MPDVRRYLREFLNGSVCAFVRSWPVRFCVVNFAILALGAKHQARPMKKSGPRGSPLVAISRHVKQTGSSRAFREVNRQLRDHLPQSTGDFAYSIERELPKHY